MVRGVSAGVWWRAQPRVVAVYSLAVAWCLVTTLSSCKNASKQHSSFLSVLAATAPGLFVIILSQP